MGDSSLAALQQVVAAAVAAAGYELWVCDVSAQMIRVYIESERGITVADCERASRQIRAALSAETLLGGYNLEVSSPGLDRRLVTPAHYQRFIGSQIRIELRTPYESRRHYTGVLQQADAEQLTLMIEGGSLVLPLENVEKANLVPNG